MTINVDAIAVESFDMMTTVEPLPGAVLQFICKAPSGMRGPLPTIWLSSDVLRALHTKLGAVLQDIDSDPRASQSSGPRH